MFAYGWSRLHLTLGDETATIQLPEVFNPFPQLVEWGSRIETGDLPGEMETDEEGEKALLTVLCTEDPERVLLRIPRRYAEEQLLVRCVERID